MKENLTKLARRFGVADARLVVPIVAAAVATAMLVQAIMLASPVFAQGCELHVGPQAVVGTPVVITGSGFPASTSVDVTMQSAGRAPVNLSVSSDTQGAFKIQLTPEPTDLGQTTVTAAVTGTSCSAAASFTVTLTAAPAARAGATHRPGPNTSTVLDAGSTGVPNELVLLALVLLFVGGFSVLLARYRGER